LEKLEKEGEKEGEEGGRKRED
jgi:hypothetical protein